MEIQVEKVGDVVVATVSHQDLDASNVKDFKRDISAVIQGPTKLVLDLHMVNFVDSSGCGAILSCLKQVNSTGGDLKLCSVTKQVRALFDLVRLHRVVDIFDSRADALKALGL